MRQFTKGILFTAILSLAGASISIGAFARASYAGYTFNETSVQYSNNEQTFEDVGTAGPKITLRLTFNYAGSGGGFGQYGWAYSGAKIYALIMYKDALSGDTYSDLYSEWVEATNDDGWWVFPSLSPTRYNWILFARMNSNFDGVSCDWSTGDSGSVWAKTADTSLATLKSKPYIKITSEGNYKGSSNAAGTASSVSTFASDTTSI